MQLTKEYFLSIPVSFRHAKSESVQVFVVKCQYLKIKFLSGNDILHLHDLFWFTVVYYHGILFTVLHYPLQLLKF